MDECLERSTRYPENQVSLAVMLWLSGVVIDQTFTLGGVDVHACLLVDHCCVNAFMCVLTVLTETLL